MRKGEKVVLLSGGNPQIAKADGDAPVQAYIAAMPGWKRDVGRRLDALIVRTVPDVHKAVKWNSPFYGIEGQGWFLGFHCFTKYVKVAFFRGTSLRPAPARRVQAQGRALPRHPRGRPARRSSARRLGEASQPIARRTNVSGSASVARRHGERSANSDGRRTNWHPGQMNDLLRFPGAVRRDPQIEAWFSDFADPLRLMTRTWFERMRGCGADVRELLHDGCPVACVGDAPFGYVNAFKAHANVGFYYGAMLADPAGLLEGAGKRMRHVKLRPGKELDVEALSDLIVAAYHDIRRRLTRPNLPPAQFKS